MGTTRWVAVVLCFALAGCGGQAPSGAGATTPTTPTTTAPVTSATPATYLLEYGRQGGFAGLDDRLVVQPDGSFAISRRGGAVSRGGLSPVDLTKLHQVLEASHFGQIPAGTVSGGAADAFTYHVVYAGHEVAAADGGVPADLRPVLTELDELLQRYGGR